ncbi:hypothetical protein QBC44DRAFT_369160 [Cladorrhinum sp. PSN332]|nr:hypothetical protein QBC44DRAFT_369160 [Cladorrhinum sp. PSN332]
MSNLDGVHDPHFGTFPAITSCKSETTDGQSSLDVNLPDDPQDGSPWESDFYAFLALPPSSPATPPPELHLMVEHHTMSGIGGRFANTLSSRASTLTIGSDCAVEMPTTPDTRSTGDVDVLTPKAPKVRVPLETPNPAMPARFGQLYPLTPSPTPIRRKRTAGPPSPPLPKRSKIAEQEASANSEDEGYSEPRTGQLHDIRQLTVNLAGSASSAIDFNHQLYPETAAGFEPPLRLQRSCTGIDTVEAYTTKPQFTLAIEWFSEIEIEEQLSKLLSVYRSFYLEPDVAQEARAKDPEGARRARQTFKAIFENQLDSAENEEFLLQEEEEDVLDVFAAWIRDMKLSQDISSEAFDDLTGCLERLADLTTAPFIRRILLCTKPMFGDEMLVDCLPSFKGACAPSRQRDGTLQWEFENIFQEFEKLHLE